MSNMIISTPTEIEKSLPLYFGTIGCMYHQEHIFRPAGFNQYQWIQCLDGEGELVIGPRKIRVKEGMGMFIYPEIPHEYYEVKKPWMVCWISFNGYEIERLLKVIGIDKSGAYFISNPEALLFRIRQIYNIMSTEDNLRGVKCSEHIYGLLMDMLKYISKSNDTSMQAKYLKLKPVFEFVEANYNRPITLEELSNTIGVTPEYLCMLFKNILGIRPFEYVNNIRINKSKDMLIKDDSLKIKDVSSLCGFEDTSYFCFVFKKTEGISPGEFKKLYLYGS